MRRVACTRWLRPFHLCSQMHVRSSESAPTIALPHDNGFRGIGRCESEAAYLAFDIKHEPKFQCHGQPSAGISYLQFVFTTCVLIPIPTVPRSSSEPGSAAKIIVGRMGPAPFFRLLSQTRNCSRKRAVSSPNILKLLGQWNNGLRDTTFVVTDGTLNAPTIWT